MQSWCTHPKVWGVVAESAEGRIVGCNFLDERNVVPGVGPVCVDPQHQGDGVGKRVMQAVIERANETGASVRLVQEAFNATSLSLYASLGFDARRPLVIMQASPRRPPRRQEEMFNQMRPDDLSACAELCRRVHGFDRTAELSDAMQQLAAVVLTREGRVTTVQSILSLNQVVGARL